MIKRFKYIDLHFLIWKLKSYSKTSFPLLLPLLLKGAPLPVLVSGLIRVAVGDAFHIIQDPEYLISSRIIRAGEYWIVTPRILILDKGRNNVILDSSSKIDITLDSNPSNAIISPLSSRAAIAVLGKVSFSVLSLDKVGLNFRLLYIFSTFSTSSGLYTPTAITLHSEYFNVVFGPPRSIIVVVQPDFAIAGGQAFGLQPTLQLVDYGLNSLGTEFSSLATASVVESLSASTAARTIDTSKSTVRNVIKSVTVDGDNRAYGNSEQIVISVNFFYEIFLTGVVTPSPRPFLLLNLTTGDGRIPVAHFLGPSLNRVRSLTFLYTVVQGDSSPRLDYISTTSLKLNQSLYGFVDGNKNKVSIVLPPKSFLNAFLSVNTNAPKVVSFTTSKADGAYGAGELIIFNVTFDLAVAVTGTPFIILTALAGNTTFFSHARAIFNSVNSAGNSRTLFFHYNVDFGDKTNLHTNLTALNTSIILPSGAIIQRLSNLLGAGTLANNSLAEFIPGFNAAHQIIIDPVGPSIDLTYGVRTDHADGVFYPGEDIFVTIRFTRPVVALGISINIVLATGSPQDPLNGIALIVGVLADDMTVLFKYTVAPRTNTTRLDIISNGAALFVAGVNTYIRRKATVPLLDVATSTAALFASGKSLRDNSNIQLFGAEPTIIDLKVIHVQQSLPLSGNLYPDDFVIIRVFFNARVVTICPPVLFVNARNFIREIPYIAGNKSDQLDFKYIVETGDNNPLGVRLSYAQPPPFCDTSGCSAFPTFCGIFADATNYIQKVNLNIPGMRTVITGINIPGGNFPTVPKSLTRNTSIILVKSRLSEGVVTSLRTVDYSAGDIIYIDVTLNDVAVINAEPFPSLFLSNGNDALYYSGISTKILTFSYIIRVGEVFRSLRPAFIPGTSSCIRCTNGCFIINAVQGFVNISTPASIFNFTSINADGRVARIIDVYSDRLTAPGGSYSVGQVIDIFVVFNYQVIVVGFTAQLRLNVGEDRFALYQPEKSNEITFVNEFFTTVRYK